MTKHFYKVTVSDRGNLPISNYFGPCDGDPLRGESKVAHDAFDTLVADCPEFDSELRYAGVLIAEHVNGKTQCFCGIASCHR